MRLMLISDVHLDAPFTWAGAKGGAHRRQGIRNALTSATELAAAEGVDAFCVAGDLFEHERVTEDTARFLAARFTALAPIPVFLAPGNHDWLGPASIYHRTSWPSNVTLFHEPHLVPVTLQDGLTLWGAAHTAPAGTRGFLEGFRVDRGGVHLALFHGSEQAAMTAEASTKIPHAPFVAAQIPAAGLAHALVGHIHTPYDGPHHTYPGNPEPLAFGETGDRGAVLLDVGPDGRVTTQRRKVAHTTVTEAELDVTGLTHSGAVREAVVELLGSRTGVARLTLRGDLDPDVDLDPDAWRAALPSLDVLAVRTSGIHEAYDIEALQGEDTVRGQFVRDVLASDEDEETVRRILTTGLRALAGRDDLEVR